MLAAPTLVTEPLGYCPRCGNALRPPAPGEAGHARCDGCALPHWEQHIPVASILLLRDGRVLLTRRAATMERGAGRWTGPGGHIEPGEDAERAALREVREEVGLDATLTGLVGVYSVRDPAVVFVSYRGTARDEPRALHETDEVRWFAPAELPWGEPLRGRRRAAPRPARAGPRLTLPLSDRRGAAPPCGSRAR